MNMHVFAHCQDNVHYKYHMVTVFHQRRCAGRLINVPIRLNVKKKIV